jgi:hypothetical protein
MPDEPTRPNTRFSRFLVQTRVPVGPLAIARLQRAVLRMRAAREGPLARAGIRVHKGCLALLVDVRGRGRPASRRAEDTFSGVWYDAFGDRGVGHRSTEVPDASDASTVEGGGPGPPLGPGVS